MIPISCCSGRKGSCRAYLSRSLMMSEAGGYGGVCASARARIMLDAIEDGEVRSQGTAPAGRLPESSWYGINQQHIGV